MELQCFGSFVDASTFQNLHRAGLEDIDFGVNEEMLLLGTEFGLEPYDLVKIIHDRKNTLNQDKVIELLNAGVINIHYISNFDRLCDLGFSITEILILLNASIPAENVLVYDLIQLYNALGCTSTHKIEYLIGNNAYPENVYPFIQAGIIAEDDWIQIPNYIKNKISPIQSIYIKLGVSPGIMIKYIANGISSDEVASFIAIGIEKFMDFYSPYTTHGMVIKFAENGMHADEVSSFKAIGIKKFTDIVKYKNAGLSAHETATNILRTNQIISTFVAMCLVSICLNILFFMLVNFEGKFADHELIFEYSSRSFFSFLVVFLLFEFLL